MRPKPLRPSLGSVPGSSSVGDRACGRRSSASQPSLSGSSVAGAVRRAERAEAAWGARRSSWS